jgi:hypothetical protein
MRPEPGDWLTRGSKFLIEPETVTAICLLIVFAAFVTYWILLWPKARRIRVGLADGLSKLNPVKGPREFAALFERLSSSLAGNFVLGPAWVRFTQTLIPDRMSGAEAPVLRSSSDPETYFNAESVVDPQINLRLYGSIPGFLTGVGILGTFLGLIAGLYLAGSQFDSQEVQELRVALRNLMSGASLAFATSIAGLLSSIAFSVAEKRIVHRITHALDEWNSALARRLERVTPERLASEQLEELVRQSQQLERFNTDLAVSLAESLESRLAVSFGPQLERLVAATERLASNQAQAQDDLLRELVERFRESLTGAADSELQGLGRMIRDLTNGMSSMIADLRRSQGDLVEATSRLSSELSGSVSHNVATLSAKTQEMVASLGSALEASVSGIGAQLKESSDAASQILADRTSATAGVIGSMESLLLRSRELIDGTSGSATNLLRASEGVEEVLKGLRSIVSQLTDGVRAVQLASAEIAVASSASATAGKQIVDAANVIREAEVQTAGAWKEYERRFKEIDRSLAAVFENLHRSQVAHSDKVSQFVQEMDEHLTRAVSSLGGVVEELSSAVESLEAAGRPRK